MLPNLRCYQSKAHFKSQVRYISNILFIYLNIIQTLFKQPKQMKIYRDVVDNEIKKPRVLYKTSGILHKSYSFFFSLCFFIKQNVTN